MRVPWQTASVSGRLRSAAAGATAATVWTLQEPVDQRLLRCDYSDVAVLGKAVTCGSRWRAAGLAIHALYRELGMRHREAVNWQCWGRSELATGHFDLAETALRESLDAFEQMRDSWFVNEVRAHLAHALCAQGGFDEADAVLEGCSGILATSARARVLAAHGDVDGALAFAREALAASSAGDWLEGRAQVLVSFAEVHRAADRPAEEAAALRDALALYERKGIKPAVERVRLRLEEMEAFAES